MFALLGILDVAPASSQPNALLLFAALVNGGRGSALLFLVVPGVILFTRWWLSVRGRDAARAGGNRRSLDVGLGSAVDR